MELGVSARGKDRLIVALDFPSASQARQLVEDLAGVVSFYKIGLELSLGEGLSHLADCFKDHPLFADLKLPNDVPETVKRAVAVASQLGFRFLTLSSSAEPATIRAALLGRGNAELPSLLYVPYLSSMDGVDFEQNTGRPASALPSFIVEQSARALEAGCDGFIASGDAITLLRRAHPAAVIVSPGIRPKGFDGDDHKRSTTPAEAILMGADYLVVGRPIRDAHGREKRRHVALAIIDEIDQALESTARLKRQTHD